MVVVTQPETSSATTVDRRGRRLRDLRISVTDRCNLRCTYCMPRSVFGPGHRFLPASNLLTPNQIETIARAFVSQGVRTVRLTGGEPLLRREVIDIVGRLSRLDVDDIALTTNGVLLRRFARDLRRAGLGRVTVSLDTISQRVFSSISSVNTSLATVLDGIAAAREAGFSPIKLNCVVRRGVNDSGIHDLVTFARREGHILRFIEFMDVGTCNGWRQEETVPAAELLLRIAARYPLEAVSPSRPGEVARRYRFSDGRGEIGMITSVSQPFCGDCSRARISADGQLFTCLFARRGTDLSALLALPHAEERLAAHIARTWQQRTDRYSETRGRDDDDGERVEMSFIGG